MDPTPEEIEAEFPGWHVWHAVNGMWYANYEKSSPPIVLKDENTTELRAQIKAKNDTLSW